MRRAKLVTIAAFLIIVILAAAALAEVPQTRQRRPHRLDRTVARRRGWEQTAAQLVQELNLDKEEAAVVIPQIRKLLILKYRGMPGLRRLKALQQSRIASAEDVAAGLKRFRNNLGNARAKIIRTEKQLVEMKEITPRRELTLTILGILDNGKAAPRIPTNRPKIRERIKRKGSARKLEQAEAKEM